MKNKHINGLYLAFGHSFRKENIVVDTTDGIARKIYYQIESFIGAGFNIDYDNPHERYNPLFLKIIRRLPIDWFIRWDLMHKDLSKYSFIYIRKPWYMGGDLISFLKATKKHFSHIKIILEVPTYPYDSELKGIKNKPLIIKDKKWRRKLYKYVDVIVTYSKDKEIFGVRTINIVNAISFDEQKRISIMKTIGSDVNIVACSRFEYWHGYDRAIKGLKGYYEKYSEGKYRFILHLVGDGNEMNAYRKYISENDLSEYVKIHGFLSGTAIKKIYAECVIGLDSLGRHRSGVEYNSSLKSKEYAANGLVIVSGVKSEFDYDDSYDYYYRVPSDDTPIDYSCISKFLSSLLEKEKIGSIQKKIMEYSKIHFDYNAAMKPVIDYIVKDK